MNCQADPSTAIVIRNEEQASEQSQKCDLMHRLSESSTESSLSHETVFNDRTNIDENFKGFPGRKFKDRQEFNNNSQQPCQAIKTEDLDLNKQNSNKFSLAPKNSKDTGRKQGLAQERTKTHKSPCSVENFVAQKPQHVLVLNQNLPGKPGLTLQNLLYVDKLGEGEFGTVYKVFSPSCRKLFALKSIEKHQIVNQKLQRHLQQQKMIQSKLKYPFVVQFQRSFKDEKHVYFLMEYIKGSELFDVIRDIGLLGKQICQFYIATLILTIQHLHKHSIIYRDLKPENVMVDQEGYLKLIDLGTCKELTKNGKTMTILGTAHYMAPQILEGKGYSYNIDLWSLGICFFQFMCGHLPYGEDSTDPYEIYDSIKENKLKFPEEVQDQKARELIRRLLSQDPQQRDDGSYKQLLNDPWFSDFDWSLLETRQMMPPYVPEISKQDEIQHLVQQSSNMQSFFDWKREQPPILSKRRSNRQSLDVNWDAIF